MRQNWNMSVSRRTTHIKGQDDFLCVSICYKMKKERRSGKRNEFITQKTGKIAKGFAGDISLVLLIKRHYQSMHELLRNQWLVDKNQSCISTGKGFHIGYIGHSNCKLMSALICEMHTIHCNCRKKSQLYWRTAEPSPFMGLQCTMTYIWDYQYIYPTTIYRKLFETIPSHERYKIIMYAAMNFSTKSEHKHDLENLFKALIKFGLWISPNKYQFFRTRAELVYTGTNFLVHNRKPCYTSMKEKCNAIKNPQPPRSFKQCWEFFGMVHFLSSFLKHLTKHLILIYNIQKKSWRFQWTELSQISFNNIKAILVNPCVLRTPIQNDKFRLKSDNSALVTVVALYQQQHSDGFYWDTIPSDFQRL